MVNVNMLARHLMILRCADLLERPSPADIVHISDDVNRKGSGIAPALLLFNPEDDAAYRAKALAKSALGSEPAAI